MQNNTNNVTKRNKNTSGSGSSTSTSAQQPQQAVRKERHSFSGIAAATPRDEAQGRRKSFGGGSNNNQKTQMDKADRLMNPVVKPNPHNLNAAPAHNPALYEGLLKVVFREPALKMYYLHKLYDLISKNSSKNLFLTLSKIQETWGMVLFQKDHFNGGDGSYQGALKVSGLVDLMNTYHHTGRCPKGATLSDYYRGANQTIAREEGLAFLNVLQLVPAAAPTIGSKRGAEAVDPVPAGPSKQRIRATSSTVSGEKADVPTVAAGSIRTSATSTATATATATGFTTGSTTGSTKTSIGTPGTTTSSSTSAPSTTAGGKKAAAAKQVAKPKAKATAATAEAAEAAAIEARTAEHVLKKRAIEFDHVNDLTVEDFMDCVLYLQKEGPKTSVVEWIGKLHRCVADIVATEEIQERLTQETVQAMMEFMHHHPQCPNLVEQADGTVLCLYANGIAVPDVDEAMAFAGMFNIDI